MRGGVGFASAERQQGLIPQIKHSFVSIWVGNLNYKKCRKAHPCPHSLTEIIKERT